MKTDEVAGSIVGLLFLAIFCLVMFWGMGEAVYAHEEKCSLLWSMARTSADSITVATRCK